MDTLLIALQTVVEAEVTRAERVLRIEARDSTSKEAVLREGGRWRPVARTVLDAFEFADSVCLEWFRAQPGIREHFEARGYYLYGQALDELNRRRKALEEEKERAFARLWAVLER